MRTDFDISTITKAIFHWTHSSKFSKKQWLKIFITVRISTVVYHDVIGDNLGGHQNFGGAEVSSNVIAVSLDEVNQTSITSMPVNEKGAIIITLPTDIRKVSI